MGEDELKRREEREKKKAEVRARLEASSVRSIKKKGFMTPERKKKLRVLLRRKAAEELKRQQEAKADERRRVIAERIGEKRNTDNMNEVELRRLCGDYHNAIVELESIKYDLEYQVQRIDYEIHELSTKVNDMRGKLMTQCPLPPPSINDSRDAPNAVLATATTRARILDALGSLRPTLRKVPKFNVKIERMLLNARKEVGFTVNLKAVRKDQFKSEDNRQDHQQQPPEWAWKKQQASASESIVGQPPAATTATNC